MELVRQIKMARDTGMPLQRVRELLQRELPAVLIRSQRKTPPDQLVTEVILPVRKKA